MKQKLIISIALVTLLALPMLSTGQYMQKLFDVDSTQDWGVNIFINPDSTYFVSGGGFNSTTGLWSVFNLTISNDGNTVIHKKIFGKNNASVYNGTPGSVKKLSTGNYICPLTIQTPNLTYNNGAAGFMKLTSTGDTIFMKTYTDTSLWYEWMLCLAILPDGGYLGGGGQENIIPTILTQDY